MPLAGACMGKRARPCAAAAAAAATASGLGAPGRLTTPLTPLAAAAR